MLNRRINCLVLLVYLSGYSFANTHSAPLAIEVKGVTHAMAKIIEPTLDNLQESYNTSPSDLSEYSEEVKSVLKQKLSLMGYFNATANVIGSAKNNPLRYHITLGQPVKVASININLVGEGKNDSVIANMFNTFPLRKEGPVDQIQYERYKQSLLTLLENRGYFDARLIKHQIRIDLNKHLGFVSFMLDTGPRYRFGAVKFVQTSYSPKLLDRFITFKPDTPFDNDYIVDLENRLSRSGFFKEVLVTPLKEHKKNLQVPINVLLKPQKRFAFLAGVGAATDSGLRARFGFDVRRVNQLGHQFGFDAQPAQYQQRVSAHYSIPGYRPSMDKFDLLAEYTQADPPHRKIHNTTQIVKLSYISSWPSTHITQSLSTFYQHDLYKDGSKNRITNLLVPEVAWQYKNVESKLNPQSGFSAKLAVRGAYHLLASSSSFAQLIAQAKAVAQPMIGTRILLRANAGVSEWEKRKSIPPSLRFYAGGRESVRGYGYQSLGPQKVNDRHEVVVEGGPYLVTASAELEQHLYKQLAIAVFFDIGNAFTNIDDGLKQGVGFGLRWQTLIGPVRLDLANALSLPNRPWRFHFSIGPDL